MQRHAQQVAADQKKEALKKKDVPQCLLHSVRADFGPLALYIVLAAIYTKQPNTTGQKEIPTANDKSSKGEGDADVALGAGKCTHQALCWVMRRIAHSFLRS